MWKLIKYELQSRYFGLILFLLGILGWDLTWIIILSRNEDSGGILLFIWILPIHGTILLLSVLLIIINTIYFYRYYQTNNLPHLQTYSVKAWKILASKLMIVIFEFLSLHFIHLAITIIFISISLSVSEEPNTMSSKAIAEIGYASISGYVINLVSFLYRTFLFYIVSILFLFSFVVLIRRMTQNSKGYFWITILLVVSYFTFFVFLVYRYILNSIGFNISLTSFSYLPIYPWWAVLFLFLTISSLLSLFIHWLYTRKTDF